MGGEKAFSVWLEQASHKHCWPNVNLPLLAVLTVCNSVAEVTNASWLTFCILLRVHGISAVNVSLICTVKDQLSLSDGNVNVAESGSVSSNFNNGLGFPFS